MVDRPIGPRVALVIAPLGIATWILATYTVGESIRPRDSFLVGFGIALLTVSLASCFLFFGQFSEQPGSRLGAVLVVCGTLCLLGALALQFYLASLAAESSRQLSGIMAEQLKTNPSVNLNLKGESPGTIEPISYFVLLAGIWLAAVGIKVGVVPSGAAAVRALAETTLPAAAEPV